MKTGFTMPPEWHPHVGTWLTWPCPQGDSFKDRLETVLPTFRELAFQLAQTEKVFINVWNQATEDEARAFLRLDENQAPQISFHHHPAYEPWCRDHGPVFVLDSQRQEKAIVDWEYNAWGGKYPPFDLDNIVPGKIATLRNLQRFTPGIVLEGGSIEVNGSGLLMTTESCLLNPNRNPSLSREQIEAHLRDYLGVDEFLWLGDGIAGDDTDGHIDDMTRFVNATTIVTAVESDPNEENYGPLQDNLKKLKAFCEQRSPQFRLVTLPMPSPIFEEGIRLPASYANFYIANGQVIVPTFNDANDKEALGILQDLFPNRRVVGIDSTKLIWGLGSFHCLTQQEPAL